MHFLWIFQLLVLIIGPLIRLALRMIGFGFVTYFGINLIIDQAKTYIITQIGGSGATILSILGLMKVDVAINIMLAAVTTRFILAGFNKATDSKRSRVWTKPGGGPGSIEA